MKRIAEKIKINDPKLIDIFKTVPLVVSPSMEIPSFAKEAP
jgi:hypothetical protein